MVSVMVCPSVHSNPNARCLHLVSKQTDNVSENQVLQIMPTPESDPLTVHWMGKQKCKCRSVAYAYLPATYATEPVKIRQSVVYRNLRENAGDHCNILVYRLPKIDQLIW